METLCVDGDSMSVFYAGLHRLLGLGVPEDGLYSYPPGGPRSEYLYQVIPSVRIHRGWGSHSALFVVSLVHYTGNALHLMSY